MLHSKLISFKEGLLIFMLRASKLWRFVCFCFYFVLSLGVFSRSFLVFGGGVRKYFKVLRDRTSIEYVLLRWLQLGLKVLGGKSGALLNSFNQDVKRVIERLERINYKIGRSKVSVLFCKRKMLHRYYSNLTVKNFLIRKIFRVLNAHKFRAISQ